MASITTIKLPYTPAPIKRFLEAKKAFMEKLSSGEDLADKESFSGYADSEIPKRLRDKYKSKD